MKAQMSFSEVSSGGAPAGSADPHVKRWCLSSRGKPAHVDGVGVLGARARCPPGVHPRSSGRAHVDRGPGLRGEGPWPSVAQSVARPGSQ